MYLLIRYVLLMKVVVVIYTDETYNVTRDTLWIEPQRLGQPPIADLNGRSRIIAA
jgi:hypothetical protein